MIVLLALAWAIVLVPSLRPRFETSPLDGVRNFERSMGILASTRNDRQVPGRWVMLPKGMHSPRSRRQRVIERRRRAFLRLVLAAGLTLVLGLIPALRVLLLAHVAIDVALLGYMVWLRRERVLEMQRRRVVRALPTAGPAGEENTSAEHNAVGSG